MADAYWKYVESKKQQQQQPAALSPHSLKRPRTEYEMPSGNDLPGNFANEDDRADSRGIRDTGFIDASYDRYLRNSKRPSFDGDYIRSGSNGLGGHHLVDDDPRLMSKGRPPQMIPVIRKMGGVPEISLPIDASNTLYVEGFPVSCSRREISHIFRPFVGYRGVRLVTTESKYSSGDMLVLCFVDFLSPAHAATAMDALQGYRVDEYDGKSPRLMLQFARNPGPRSGGGHWVKR
ncbi:hypothetical protein ACP275_06G100200 [Erythranthe tilingii]